MEAREAEQRTWDPKSILSDSKAYVPKHSFTKYLLCAYCVPSSLPGTTLTQENMKADLLDCDLNVEVLTSRPVQKEGIMIMMIIFCYFNFLNKAAMVNLGIMYESIIFLFALVCLTSQIITFKSFMYL